MAWIARILKADERIVLVGSANEGWKALRAASGCQADLALLDFHMPGCDGAEIAWALKQRPDPPVIFIVTSDDSAEARARSLRAGADAFLLKTPGLPSQLLPAIQNFFPIHLDQNVSESPQVSEVTSAAAGAKVSRTEHSCRRTSNTRRAQKPRLRIYAKPQFAFPGPQTSPV